MLRLKENAVSQTQHKKREKAMSKKAFRIAFFFITLRLIPEQGPAQEYNLQECIDLFSHVYSLVNQKYYLPIAPQDALFKALDALVACDPHSSLLQGKAFQDILETAQGELSGIGIIIGPKEHKDDPLTILEVVYGGPADKAGMKFGDVIVAIGDELVHFLSMEEIAHRLKGAQGTQITLTVMRGDQLKEFTLTRDTIKDEQVHCYFFPQSRTYYIIVKAFNEHVYRDMKKALIKAQAQKATSLIIDMRNNSGGLLAKAVDCASLFIPKRSLVVSIKDRKKKVLEECRTSKPPLNFSHIPLCILVNNITASAAEIFAATLRLYSQKSSFYTSIVPPVFIVGASTFGKGSVQELIKLTSTVALKLTTSLYYLADGSVIQGEGVMPDFKIQERIEIPQTVHAFVEKFGREGALRNSLNKEIGIKRELEKLYGVKDIATRRREALEKDFLVRQAITFLSVFQLAQKSDPGEVKTHNAAVRFISQKLALGDVAVEEVSI